MKKSTRKFTKRILTIYFISFKNTVHVYYEKRKLKIMAGLHPPPVAMGMPGGAPIIVPINTVRSLLVMAGVNDTDLYQNMTPAERMAEEMFGNDMESFLDINNKKIIEDMNSYGELSVAQGRLRYHVGVRNSILGMACWVRHEYCLLYTSPSPRDS